MCVFILNEAVIGVVRIIGCKVLNCMENEEVLNVLDGFVYGID